MGYNLLTTGIYWGYNPFTNHLLTSWNIQVGCMRWPFQSSCDDTLPETNSKFAPENRPKRPKKGWIEKAYKHETKRLKRAFLWGGDAPLGLMGHDMHENNLFLRDWDF